MKKVDSLFGSLLAFPVFSRRINEDIARFVDTEYRNEPATTREAMKDEIIRRGYLFPKG